MASRVRWITALTLLLVVAACGETAPQQAAAPTPAAPPTNGEAATPAATAQRLGPLEFDAIEHDFGVLPDDLLQRDDPDGALAARATHRFPFRVVGPEAVVIEKITTTCGCTTGAGLGRYAPGSEGAIEVRYDPSHRQGPETRHIDLFLEGETTPLRLTVKVEVDAAFAMSPRSHWFGEVQQGEASKPFRFEIICRDPTAPLDLPRILRAPPEQGPTEGFEVTALGAHEVEVLGTMRRAEAYEVRFLGRPEVGRVQARLEVVPRVPGARPVVGVILGAVVGPLRAVPDLLSVQETEGARFSRLLRIGLREAGSPLRVLEASIEEPAPANLTITRTQDSPESVSGPQQWLSFEVSGTMPPSRHEGRPDKLSHRILLSTDHPEQPTLVVPLTLYVRPAAR